MKHSGGNQACYVLGQKTPSIRDLYSLGHKLGQGQFGTTYMCREISTGREYACKSITKRKLISKEDVEDVRREIQIMHHLAGYKNIVTIKGAYEDPLYVHIVMELCSGGELFDRIIQRGHYSERKAAELIKIIVGVVEACHSLGVMHRDLKPENFLLVNKDDDFSLKAIDFGLSVFFKPGQIFEDVVGSPYYVAPEVLLKHYGPEADVWTAGVILYILVSGVPPFWAETQQGIFDAVLKGHIDFDSDPWPLISDSAKDLIRGMLCSRPSERLTAHQVLRHPWICENGVAPDRALDPAVLSRLKQFSAMNKLKQMALRVIAESLSEEEIAGLKEMFKAMDTDNSGAITFDELKAGLRRYGSTLKDTEIRDLMEAADIDKSGTIDYGEFIAATIHLNKLEREEHLLSAFRYFDKDGSGYITIDELQHACVEQGMSDVFLEDVIKEVDQDNVRDLRLYIHILWLRDYVVKGQGSLFKRDDFECVFRAESTDRERDDCSLEEKSMCIAVFMWQSHPLYPFLLFLNRDEHHSRATEALRWWEDGETVGGRDLVGGGTWLGCTRHGRLAFLTNFREASSLPDAKSRGDLPLRFLQSRKTPAEFAEEIQEEIALYNGFNLVVAHVLSKSMIYITNRPRHGDNKLVTQVSPGIHVLSNANLDSPWPKCVRLTEGFKQLLAENGSGDFPVNTMVDEVMTNTVKDDETELPRVFTPETEYQLSSIFVDIQRPTGRYGTRSISAISIKSHGEVCFYEKHLEDGDSWKEHTLQFVLQNQS